MKTVQTNSLNSSLRTNVSRGAKEVEDVCTQANKQYKSQSQDNSWLTVKR